jgi:hypothetical protein
VTTCTTQPLAPPPLTRARPPRRGWRARWAIRGKGNSQQQPVDKSAPLRTVSRGVKRFPCPSAVRRSVAYCDSCLCDSSPHLSPSSNIQNHPSSPQLHIPLWVTDLPHSPVWSLTGGLWCAHRRTGRRRWRRCTRRARAWTAPSGPRARRAAAASAADAAEAKGRTRPAWWT